MVVGFSNTAADTATELVGQAKDIYLAHRRGNIIVRNPDIRYYGSWIDI